MTHFEWRIDYLKKYSSLGEHSNIVYQVGYTCTGINTSGIRTDRYSIGGATGLSTESLADPIPYSSKVMFPYKYINDGDELEVVNFPWE